MAPDSIVCLLMLMQKHPDTIICLMNSTGSLTGDISLNADCNTLLVDIASYAVLSSTRPMLSESKGCLGGGAKSWLPGEAEGTWYASNQSLQSVTVDTSSRANLRIQGISDRI